MYICIIRNKQTIREMKNVNINSAGIKKAMNDRNSVLEAMGFGCDNMEVIINESEVLRSDTAEKSQIIARSRYGSIVEREISVDVFEVEYENHNLYLIDLSTKKNGYFAGE